MKKGKKRLTKADLEARLNRVYRLFEVGRIINSDTDLDRILEVVISETTALMEADRSSLFLVDWERGELWSRVAEGPEIRETRMPMDGGIAGCVVASGRILNIPDAYQDPRFNPEMDWKTGYRTQSILCLPVRNNRKEIIGVLQVLNKRNGAFTEEDEKLLSCLADQIAVALEDANTSMMLLNCFFCSS